MAVVTILLTVIAHTRLVIVEDNLLVRSLPSRMASGGWSVVRFHNPVPEAVIFRDIEPFINPEPVIAHCKVRHGELDTLRPNGGGQPREAFVHGLDDSLHELVVRVGIPNKVLQRGLFWGFNLWFRGCCLQASWSGGRSRWSQCRRRGQ
jgi:hypothetical protein